MTTAAALLGLSSAAPAHAACEDLLPPDGDATVAHRAVKPVDVARLRDIGQPTERTDLESPLGLSPDGRQVAFVLRRADPQANAYCQGLVVADLEGGQAPRLVDRGGDLIRDHYPLFGHALPESGVPRVITPRWSADGRHIAWLKRVGPTAQIWLASRRGGDARQLTHEPAGVEDFAWLPDSTGLVLSARVGMIDARQAIEREGLGGWLVDRRFRPVSGPHPFPRNDSIETRNFTVALSTGETRKPSDTERDLVPGVPMGVPAHAIRYARARSGSAAWTLGAAGDPLSRTLVIRSGDTEIACGRCAGEILDLWWQDDGSLLFVRREDKARAQLGIYRLRAGGDRAPARILLTDDLILGCRPIKSGRAICLREASTSPRHLILLNTRSGRIAPFWDPNPQFRRLAKGKVERLRWTNAFGIETFGDLALPPGHRAGERHPLIVVQYGSRGFLRGGTGDEYPILALAAHGHAVLSFQRPLHWSLATPGLGLGPRSDDEDHADRKSVQSSLERGIDLAIARGAILPDRIGITGLSDGVATVQWALTHGDRFAAAAMSSCCMDPSLVQLLGEAQVEAWMEDGLPAPTLRDAPYWAEASLARNVGRVDAPILMQLSDNEFLGAFESYWALRTAGRPVEMFVFQGERHIKFQPAHRLAIYERNLQWFDFWLRDIEDPSAALRPQYARWRAMRDAWAKVRWKTKD